MNIDGLGPETVDTFYRLGLIKDTADLYQLTAEDIKNLDRMGEKSAETLLKESRQAKKFLLKECFLHWEFVSWVKQ